MLVWVAQAEEFVLSRAETALTFSDQIPVWLQPQAGKVLVRQDLVHQAAACRRAKKRANPWRTVEEGVYRHRKHKQNDAISIDEVAQVGDCLPC